VTKTEVFIFKTKIFTYNISKTNFEDKEKKCSFKFWRKNFPVCCHNFWYIVSEKLPNFWKI